MARLAEGRRKVGACLDNNYLRLCEALGSHFKTDAPPSEELKRAVKSLGWKLTPEKIVNAARTSMVISTAFFGLLAVLGGVDDYVKLKGIGTHRGISARVKSFWQVLIALIVGIFVYLYPDITTNLDVPAKTV